MLITLTGKKNSKALHDTLPASTRILMKQDPIMGIHWSADLRDNLSRCA